MSMKKKLLFASTLLSSLTTLSLAATPATPMPTTGASNASTPSAQELQQQINKIQAELNAAKKKDSLNDRIGIGTRGFLNDRIVFSGGVMSQLSVSKYKDSGSFNGGQGRDLNLSTAYLTMHGIVNKNLSAFMMVGTEPKQINVTGGIGGVEFEEAYANYITQMSNNSRFSMQLGRTYVPFGIYKIHPVVASLTQTLDETNREAAVFGYARPLFFVSAYAIGALGTVDKNSGSVANKINGGARIGSGTVKPTWAYEADLDYIENMAESREINFLLPTTYKRVPNLAFHLMGSLYHFDVGYNLSRPLQSFNSRDMLFNGSGASPSAQSLGLNYRAHFMDKLMTLSATYEVSKQSLAIGMPKNRIILNSSVEINPYLTVMIEGLRSKDYKRGTTAELPRRTLDSTFSGSGRVNITGILEMDLHF